MDLSFSHVGNSKYTIRIKIPTHSLKLSSQTPKKDLAKKNIFSICQPSKSSKGYKKIISCIPGLTKTNKQTNKQTTM